MKSNSVGQTLNQLLEELASIEHDRWAHWQRHLHSKCIPQGGDGDLLIPGALVRQWERQIATPYTELAEDEKESDREQVRKYLSIIVDALEESQK